MFLKICLLKDYSKKCWKQNALPTAVVLLFTGESFEVFTAAIWSPGL
jgi:hypothetical protein